MDKSSSFKMAAEVEMDKIVNRLRSAGYRSGKTRGLQFRKAQLRNLLNMIDENESELVEALSLDLGKPRVESIITELDPVRNSIRSSLHNLDKWAQAEKVEKSLVVILDEVRIEREPFGVVLAIGPWNYPFHTLVIPVVDAMSAGNCVVIKPSEMAPSMAQALQKLIPKYLDADCYSVVTGGVEETTALLSLRFDHIVFTGSPRVGKIVAKAASAHLTPCTLELGGKSPVYVGDDLLGNLEVTAKRIIWGKAICLGQTCVAPDYVLCSRKVQAELVEMLKKVYLEQYGKDASKSPDLARIVNERQYDRLRGLLERTAGTVEMGNKGDREDRFLDLHVVANVRGDDALMEEELFGPILPVVPVNSADEAIEFINDREKPLALYIFSNNTKLHRKFLASTSAGGVVINDVAIMCGLNSLPFGGVGESGYGHYHGKHGFDNFSHKKAVVHRGLGFINESLGNFRYAPYTDAKFKLGAALLKTRPPILPSWLCAGLTKLGLVALGALGTYLAMTCNHHGGH